MIHRLSSPTAGLLALLATASPLAAQTTLGQEAQAEAPKSLVLYFGLGSTAVRPSDVALLDQAARLYRDGHPIIMVLTGGTDAVGSPEVNLRISQARTASVLHGLVSRGIPAERFQLLAKGESEPAVPAPPGVAEAQNRRVEIRWR